MSDDLKEQLKKAVEKDAVTTSKPQMSDEDLDVPGLEEEVEQSSVETDIDKLTEDFVSEEDPDTGTEQDTKPSEEELKELREDVEKEISSVKSEPKKHNYETHTPVGDKQDIDKVTDDLQTPVLPSGDSDAIYAAVLLALSRLADEENAPESVKNWVSELNIAGEIPLVDNILDKSLEKGKWVQGDTSKYIGPSEPSFAKPSNAEVSATDILFLATESSKIGAHIQVPLEHSGFSVTIQPPSQIELAVLADKLTTEKVELGRSTYGLLYTNQRAIVTGIICEFILDNVIATTKQVLIKNEIIKLSLSDISIFDAPLLMGGLLKAIFRNGVDYSRPCISDPGVCDEVYTGILDLNTAYFRNTDALNDFQLTHMASRTKGSHPVDKIGRYKETLPASIKHTVQLNESISVELKEPSIQDYLESRTRWSNTLTTVLEEAVKESSGTTSREDILNRMISNTVASQYAHFVKVIRVDTAHSKDEEGIDKVLNAVVSGDPDMLKAFIDGVKEYIAKSTIALYAVEVEECPKCNKLPTEEEFDYVDGRWLIPMEMSNFFTLSIYYRYMTSAG